MQPQTFKVTEDGRLDAAVKLGSGLSNSKARAAIESGKIFLGDTRVMDPSLRVKAGTVVELRPNAPNPEHTEPSGLRLVFRDDHLLVVDKPAGLLSAPIPDSDETTALHAAYKLARGGDRPRNVHRLDKETSGLLLFARTTEAARALRHMLDEHDVRRLYRCVVRGVPKPAEGLISSMIVRDTGEGRRGSRPSTFKVRPLNTPDPGAMPGYGKLAITRYALVQTGQSGQSGQAGQSGQFALGGGFIQSALEVWLSTGRTHQIRIHLSELGCPVLGERVYAKVPGARRQALHAAKLSFKHPITNQVLSFESPWPSDLADVTPIPAGW